jgi:FlaG/FlaF family flagellin (archaellin)
MDRRTRAVTSALTYALTIAIVVTLTGALLVGTETYITQQRQQTVQDQIDVVGQRLAATISTADRLTTTDGDVDSAGITRHFPAVLAGSQYTIEIVETDPARNEYRLDVEVRDLDISSSATVRLSDGTDLVETTVNGGSLRVVFVSGDLEVRNA